MNFREITLIISAAEYRSNSESRRNRYDRGANQCESENDCGRNAGGGTQAIETGEEKNEERQRGQRGKVGYLIEYSGIRAIDARCQ